MATAEHITETVNTGVLLTLTPDEAQAMAEVFGRVGGNHDTARAHIDNVAKSLRALGYDFTRSRNPNCPMARDSSIRFRPLSEIGTLAERF